jgi:diaminopimelate decarboxylase
MNYALNSALSNFSCNENNLSIGGCTFKQIAEEHTTPIYIYSTDIIKAKCKMLREILPEEIKIYYAVKANPNLEVIRLMGDLYDGFDVASKGEAERVIEAGISAAKISFAGPGKTISEISYAIENQIGSLSIENQQEYLLIRDICRKLNKKIDVFIRVNPDFELSHAGMKMGGAPKQFGVDSEQVPSLISNIVEDKYVNYEGIHIYAGSQNLDSSELLSGFEKILEYANFLVEKTAVPIKYLNMGGGFGIPYFAHEKDLDLAAVGEGLNKLLKYYGPKLSGTKYITEFGRYLVGESGIYLARVLYKKISKGQTFVIINGGMHHHLAASGNFGQSLVRRPMPVTVANKQNSPLEKVHVVGPLCTPLDTFGYIDLPRVEEGDLIAVLNSGAYGYSASPQLFLSHKTPKEIMV